MFYLFIYLFTLSQKKVYCNGNQNNTNNNNNDNNNDSDDDDDDDNRNNNEIIKLINKINKKPTASIIMH